jgi:ribosome-binding factor A
VSGRKRIERVGDLLRDELSGILREVMHDPRLGLVGVTAVELTSDLQHAKVYLSSADPKADMEEVVRVLSRASGFIRAELGRRRLDLRHLPELRFVHDRSVERGNRIEELLRDLHEGKAPSLGEDEE